VKIKIDKKALADPKILRMRMLAAFKSPSYRPPLLPSVAVKLLELSKKPDADIQETVYLLEQDSVLAGRMLRTAQSPIYAAIVPIKTLKDAVVRLGRDVVAEIMTMEVMHMRVFKVPGYQDLVDTLRKHCTATGYICRIVCNHAGISSRGTFLYGLMHDVGIVACLLLIADLPRGKKTYPIPSVLPALVGAHESAGRTLCKLWGLPVDVIKAVSHHHSFRLDNPDHKASMVVGLAEAVAADIGFGLEGEDLKGQADSAMEGLGLRPEVYQLIWSDAEQLTHHIQ
jgi:HD-like signal output (HDOD) protein